MSITTRIRLFAVILVFACIAGPAAAQRIDCSATAGMAPDPADAGLQWRRWERRVPSQFDYLGPQEEGNPSHDVELTVTFTQCNVARNPQRFTTSGYWHGRPGGSGTLPGQDFRIRGAFPEGTWQWELSCTSPDGVVDCAGDSGLQGASGRFVIGETATTALSTTGFLKVVTPGGKKPSYLAFTDGTPFFWLGDTVWNANVLTTQAEWSNQFVPNRAAESGPGKNDGFTILQLAIAPKSALDDDNAPLPEEETRPFVSTRASGCPTTANLTGPGRCARMNTKFWENVDLKIRSANEQGLIVVLAGLIEPISGAASNSQGKVTTNPADVRKFVDAITRRYAGDFVIFSPGFDHRVMDNSGPVNRDLIDSVGMKINAITRRHLIANHTAGGANVSFYNALHNKTWLDFELFQSGTPGGNEEDELNNLTFRAEDMASKLSTKTPLKPAVNGESVYPGQDSVPNNMYVNNHTPYRARQTAYLSMLSGARGYTMGVCGVFDWNLKSGFAGCTREWEWNHAGPNMTARSMKALRSHFQSVDWPKLIPQPVRILQGTPEPELKMALSYDGSSAILAYVPNEIPSITINFGAVGSGPAAPPEVRAVPTLGTVDDWPDEDWVATWLNPRDGTCRPVNNPEPQSTSTGVFVFTKPGAGTDRDDCEREDDPTGNQCNDWLLRVSLGGEQCSASSAPSALIGQLKTAGAPGGHRMIVWQTRTATSTNILGRIVDSQGGVVKPDFVIASGPTAFPGHPSVAALPSGEFVVAWSGADKYNHGPWIRTKRYSNTGVEGPEEFPAACNYVAGDYPRIAAVGSGHVIAWEMSDTNGIYVLWSDGTEARLEQGSDLMPIIETLSVTGDSVRLNYGLYAENGSTAGGGDNVIVSPQPACGPPALAVNDEFDTDTDRAVTIGIHELLENDAPGIELQSIGSKCPLIAGGKACTYTPAPGFAGVDTFSYTVTRGGVSESATVTIAVFGTGSGPIARPDTLTMEGDQSLTISSTDLLSNDSPSTAVFGGASDAVNGTVSCTGANPATCTFTPVFEFRGTAGFKYSISHNGISVTGNVTITVTEPPPAPLVAAFTVSCGPTAQHPQDGYRTCRVHSTSTGDITRWLWSWGDGTPVIESGSGDQIHTYAQAGLYDITHTVYDATGRFRVAHGEALANTPPIAVNDAATTRRNTSVIINVIDNDSDPDHHSIALTGDPIILPPARGSAIPLDDSRIEYTPNDGYAGPDQFRYEIIDELGAPASALVTITVTNSGPPVARNDFATTKRDTPVTINLLANDEDPDGQAIWLTVNPIKTQPRHGTIEVLSPTSVRYTPELRWGGNDVFEYQIADASGAKDRAWVAVHVGRTRSLPVAVDDSVSTTANRAVTINVLENDSSPDGDPITLTGHPFLARPLHGRVSRVSDSQVSYTPQADWAGTDTFAYEISDSEYGTAAAFVTVTVTSENRPPDTTADGASTVMGVPVTLNVLSNDSDPDGDTLALTDRGISDAADHGLATRASFNSVTYTPAAGYIGTDTFQYEVSDGHPGGITSETVTITITATNTNHPPVALDDDASTAAGVPVTIEVTANDSDEDGHQISLIGEPVISGPNNGTAVKVNGSSITYTPRSGFSGTDRFQYEIGDHNGGRDQAWVDVTVGAGTTNRNPVAVDDEVTMVEGNSKNFIVTANDYDPDGDTVSLISDPVTFDPVHGTAIRLDENTIRYTPAAGYVGMDTLQYEIGDNRGKRSRAWMRVMVREANSRPVAVGDEASTAAGTPVTVNVTANDYDPDGDTVELLAGSSPIITPPDHGTATKVDANRIKYVPQAGFGGTDRFQYEIKDGRGGHHRAWVNITVTGGSSSSLKGIGTLSTTGVPPLAGNDAAEALTDTSVAVVVLSNDLSANGSAVVLTANPVITPPLFGTAQRASDTTITYTPSIAFRGNDRLEYEVIDANGVKTTAWVTVQIPGDNQAPLAVADVAVAAKDGSVFITPAANDTDGNGDALALTVRAVTTAPLNGSVRRESDTQLQYTPAPGFIGDDTFVYEITDRRGGSAQAAVVVHVIGGAQAPVAANDSATVQSGRAVAVNVVANDSDPDGDPVRVVSSLPPQHGTILWSGGTATYQSHGGYAGPDTFGYTISDPTGLSAQGTVSVTVAVANNATIAANDSAQTKTRTPVLIGVLANDYDPDPQRLTVAAVTQPAHGTVTISNDRLSVTYTPASDFAGNEAFQYTVSDGLGTVTAPVAVTVTNQAPWPHSDILSAPEDTWVGYQSYNVIGNDVDPDGDDLHIVSVEQPVHGQFIVAPDSNQFSYKSKPDWSGMDSFYYTVADPFGAQVRVLAQILVSAVNDSPVANDDSFSVYKNQVLNLTQAQIVANDTDVEGHAISVYSVGPAANGTARMLEDGSIEYTPYGEFVGTDSFEYTAQDSGGGAYATARVTVTVLQDTKPVADFTVTCNGFACAFDAGASTDDRGIVSYQWLLKTGAPTSTPAAGKTFSFTYPSEGVFEARLTVQDVLGQTAVAVKFVTVCAPPAIAAQPASQTIFSGSTATLSVTAGGTGPFSYQWYEGTAGNTTTPVGTDSSTYTTPSLTANKSYWVRVTSTCSGSGISVNSNTAAVTVCQYPGFATTPASTTINSGSTATLTVVASGSGPFTYQWYDADTNTLVASGSSSYTTPALTATKSYWAKVTSTCNGSISVTSNIATVSVCVPPAITTHPEPKVINSGSWTTLTVAAGGSGAFNYQWFEGASGVTTTPVGTNSDTFTTPPLSANKTYWARVTSTCNGGTANSNAATVTVCIPASIATQPQSKSIPTGTSTTLTVVGGGSGTFSYQWYEGTAPTTTTPVGANSSTFTTPVLTANQSYWVRVTSWCNGSTSANSATATITMACATAPSISASPTSRTIVAGTSTTLSVTASGFGPLTYQWYQGTVPSTATPVGTNSNSLTVTPGATTNYWVRVSNDCGGTNSTTATVTVCNPPVITTHPASTTINYNATATLTVAATGTGPFSYQWYEGAGAVTTTPVGTNSASYTTPPLAATKSYWVRVSNACSTNSNAATVTVNGAVLARRQFGTNTANSQLTITTNWTQPTQAGTLLVAVVSAERGAYPIANWQPPAGWQLAVSYEMTAVKTAIYYYPNNPGGRTAETFANGGYYDDMILQLAEYTGIVATAPLDKTAFNGNTSNDGSVDTGYTPQTSQGKELVITALTSYAMTEFYNPSQGFLELDDRNQGWGHLTTAVHEKIVTTAGSWGHSNQVTDPAQWVGVVATFKGQ